MRHFQRHDWLSAAIVFLGLLLLFPPDVLAQREEDPDTALSLLRQRARGPSAGHSAGVPMEGAVDVNAYIVGPGDVFTVALGGPEPISIPVPVSADGYLTLPDAGSIRVAGMTLAEARASAIATLRPLFRNVRIDVSLAQPRQFFVHVTGAVPAPGRYLAMPVARLAGVVEQAFEKDRAAVANPAFRPSLRNVTIHRMDGSALSIDLLKYLAAGDMSQNPYLKDGDQISIPAYDPSRESVFIDGAVAFPGSYAFREGETVAELIALASGKQGLNPPHGVRITRRTEDGRMATTEVTLTSDGGGVLRSLDRVHVPLKDVHAGRAFADGALQNPGTFPIQEGVTSLADLIDMAGGLRPDALKRGIYVERRALPEPANRWQGENHFDTVVRLIGQVRSDSIAILSNLRAASLDFPSRAYFAQEIQIQNRVSIDPEMLTDTATGILLRHGDRLVVPRDEQTVFVFGQVTRPGFIPLRESRRAEDYVAAAGGPATLATETFVIEAGTGRFVPAHQATVRSGDIIFVDRQTGYTDSAEMTRLQMEQWRMEMEERRMRMDRRDRRVQLVFQAASTVTAFVTTYILLTRNR
jgi:polysaccharide biosynthesis/export protein